MLYLSLRRYGAWSAYHLRAAESSLAQSAPTYPLAHAHLPALHLPWPEQPFGQVGDSQYVPLHPSSHSHVRSGLHVPRLEQPFLHVAT